MTDRLCRTFLGIAALLLARGIALAGIVDVNTEQAYDVPETVHLTVRNTDGRIYIYGSDDPQLHVKALKRAFSQERADAIELRVEVQGDSATIDTVYPPPAEGGLVIDRSGTVDYTILVPQYCTLSSVELTNGEVLIEGIRGEGIRAKVENGKIIVRNSFAPTEVSVGKGSMELFFGWWEEWNIQFPLTAEVTNGDIRLSLAEKAALKIDASAPNGHINNHFNLAPEAAPDHDDEKTLQGVLGRETENVWTNFLLRAENGNIRISPAF